MLNSSQTRRKTIGRRRESIRHRQATIHSSSNLNTRLRVLGKVAQVMEATRVREGRMKATRDNEGPFYFDVLLLTLNLLSETVLL